MRCLGGFLEVSCWNSTYQKLQYIAVYIELFSSELSFIIGSNCQIFISSFNGFHGRRKFDRKWLQMTSVADVALSSIPLQSSHELGTRYSLVSKSALSHFAKTPSLKTRLRTAHVALQLAGENLPKLLQSYKTQSRMDNLRAPQDPRFQPPVLHYWSSYMCPEFDCDCLPFHFSLQSS